MEIRRALLLFAIVLGLAAIASSIARPPERGGDATTGDKAASAPPGAKSTPSAAPPTESPQPTTVTFDTGAKSQTRRIEQGQAATVLVDVATPSQVDIPSLGLTEPGEPLTPALFEIRATERGSHPVMVQPAASETLPTRIGTLKVVPAS